MTDRELQEQSGTTAGDRSVFFYDTAVGRIGIAADGDAITHLVFGEDSRLPGEVRETPAIAAAAGQIAEYLAGMRDTFDVTLKPAGTEFQRAVWRELQTIPYGETLSYGEIARRIGRPKACRAVGMANNRNPISIIVPCHRVIGADGSLVGYGGGLDVKRKLLALEKDAIAARECRDGS